MNDSRLFREMREIGINSVIYMLCLLLKCGFKCEPKKDHFDTFFLFRLLEYRVLIGIGGDDSATNMAMVAVAPQFGY